MVQILRGACKTANDSRQHGLFHYRRVLLLIAIFALAAAETNGQSRGLSDVTALQLADLPRLSGGAQAWGDYDQDKRPDLLITGETAAGKYLTRLYHNTGNGFEDKSSLMPNLPQLANSAAAWGDYDMDGRLDLILIGNNGQGFATMLYHNNGNGFDDRSNILVVGLPTEKLPALAYGTVTWADFNNDTYPDLFISGKSSDGPFSGLFTYEIFHTVEDMPYFQYELSLPGLPAFSNGIVACADFNRDGSPDLMMAGDAVGGKISRLYLSYMHGYTDATALVPALPPLSNASFATGDYDVDGLPDLLVTGQTASGSTGRLYHNILTQSWNDFEEITTDIQALKRSRSGWADYDHDGRPDLMIAGYANDGSLFGRLYHNTADGFVNADSLLSFPAPMVDGSITWGDYNNDGWPDLIYTGVSNLSDTIHDRGIRVYKNNGNGTFIDDTKIILGTDPTNITDMPVRYGTVTFIDYENSGKQDLFFMGQDYDAGAKEFYSVRYFLLNEGTKFTNTNNWSIGMSYLQFFPFPEDQAGYISLQDGATVWGDYNNDKLPDLLTLGQFEPSKGQDKDQKKAPVTNLFQNAGGKKYANNVTSILPSNHPNLAYSSADWGDYDKDGWIDLILSGSDGANYHTLLYHNNAGQNFTDVSALLPGLPQLAYSSVTWGDYDNDSKLDLVLSGKTIEGNAVSKLYHNTSSGFVDVTSLLPGLTGVYTGTISWVDYDNDGLLDLLFSGDTGNGAVTKLYRNKGFKALFEDKSALIPSLPQVAAGSAAFGDYDKDGRPDLLITGITGNGTAVSKLYHNTLSGFDPSGLLLNHPGLANSSMAWVDYDSDGWTDLLLTGTTTSGGLSTLFHNVGADSSTLLPDLQSLSSGAAAWVDYDSDGRMDVIIAGMGDLQANKTTLYHNTGKGFENTSSLLPGLTNGLFSALSWTDYDNDGKPDLLVTGTASKLYHNTGNGFEDAAALFPGLPNVSYGSLAWADFDNDGRQDLLLTGVDGANNVSKLYRNTANGFEDRSAFIPNMPEVQWGAAAWADYDRDGNIDFLLSGLGSDGAVTKLYHNTGNGFIDSSNLLPGLPQLWHASVAWSDYDNDGWQDLFIAGQNQNLSLISKLYRNTAKGFTDVSSQVPGLEGMDIRSANWSDYDNDGKPDLLLATNTAIILFHNLDNSFERIPIEAVQEAVQVVAGDYDNNGRPDLLYIGQNSRLLKNYSPTPNTPPAVPAGLSSQLTASGIGIRFRWQHATDAQTPQPALRYNLRVSNTPGGQDVQGPMADLNSGYRRVFQSGNYQDSISTLTGLTPGATYYWSVQTIDGAFAGSAFAAEQKFTMPTIDRSELLPGLPGVSEGALAWGDYDNDKLLDLLITGDASTGPISRLYHNTGNGFEDRSALIPGLPGLQYSAVAWGDYDNDGLLDMLVCGLKINSVPFTALYHNTGNGFEDASSRIPGLPQIEVAAAGFSDYDNDGKLDFMITGSQAPGLGLVSRLYHNTGSGFEDMSRLLPGLPDLEAGTVAWADYNNDGRPDLFISGYSYSQNEVSLLYQNNGKGFDDKSALLPGLPGLQRGTAAWGDYDNDGLPDLFIAGMNQTGAFSLLYHNTGTKFTNASAEISNLPAISGAASAFGDFDNDGWPDLVISGINGETVLTKMYRNTHSGFEEMTNLTPVLVQAGNSALALGDYDNDNKLDLIVTGSNPQQLASKLYHNPGTIVNTPPAICTGLSSEISRDRKSAILRWQVSDDKQTPAAGLHYNIYMSDIPGKQNRLAAHADIQTGFRRVVQTGNSHTTSYTISGLVPGSTYYWSVQAIDAAFAGSPFAAEQNFKADTIALNGLAASVFPNPVRDKFTVRVERALGNTEFVLVDLAGCIQFTRNAVVNDSGHLETFTVASLPAGIYVLNIVSAQGVYGIKVLKQ